MTRTGIIIEGSRLGDNQHIWIGLAANVFGVGKTRAYEVCDAANIDPQMKVKELSADQVETIRTVIKEKGWVLTTNLRQAVSQAIKTKKMIRSHQGRRHAVGLPVRGQNTQKNAKTSRRRGRKKS